MKIFGQHLHKDEVNNLILFVGCWLIYTMTGFAKSSYAATISYIVSEGIYTKSASGVIASSFYILYGIGQIFGGKIADKFSPYKIITFGVAFATLASITLTFTYNYLVVLIVWSLNGLMQFGIWPGISKIISTDILPKTRQKVGFHISYGLSAGSIISYLVAAIFLNHFGWHVMFGVSTLVLLLTLLIWLFTSSRVSKNSEANKTVVQNASNVNLEQNISKEKKNTFKVFAESGILFTLIPALFITMLNNGAQVWVPTMLMESYTLSSSWASIQAMVILIIQIPLLIALMPLLQRIKNEMFGRLMLYALTIIPFSVLIFIGRIPQIVAIIMFILALLLMNLAGALNVSINTRFNKFGLTGTISGLVNSMAAFGIVCASGLYGSMAEFFSSWTTVSILWVLLAVAIVLFHIPATIYWKKFTQ